MRACSISNAAARGSSWGYCTIDLRSIWDLTSNFTKREPSKFYSEIGGEPPKILIFGGRLRHPCIEIRREIPVVGSKAQYIGLTTFLYVSELDDATPHSLAQARVVLLFDAHNCPLDYVR